MIRDPFVAGQFYPSNPSNLFREVDNYMKLDGEEKEIKAGLIMAPHAGYLYSGRVAGKTFAMASIPSSLILLGPNHTGIGTRFSLWHKGGWMIPGAKIPINEELSQQLLSEISILRPDISAHLQEHSLEVLLPFLWRKNPSVTIVPISIMETDPHTLLEVGEAISSIIKDRGDIALIVSSDMSHFISHEEAVYKDRLAIEAILNIDPIGLYNVVRKNNITMCGVLPMTVGLSCVKALGCNKAKLVEYTTSGEITGDMDRVVGYAGVIVY